MWKPINYLEIIFLLLVTLMGSSAMAQDLNLKDLVREAMARHPDILASRARLKAAEARIPQASSLPDPMLMTGYQNEGFGRFTYGEEQGAQWMFSASQTFPLGGKLNLKGDMAESDLNNLKALHEALVYKTVAGGESFLVSIAMALGLSDMSGNGQKIESLFIDEGFGYLDDETLYNVLSTLKNLKNKRKMVGIVSHIKMLENEIPTKVKITKLSGGVSRLDVVA